MPDEEIQQGAGIKADWTHPAVILATGLWLGRIPIAPGTFGALWGLPLAWQINSIQEVWLRVIVIVGICAAGVRLCTLAAAALGGGEDPQQIVFDEIASLPITFFLVPIVVFRNPFVWIIGFALHRLFDITKPPPARQLEGLPKGLGIMADDWAAGVYSCLVLHMILWTGWLT
jgi:phosphatidylglycerophosphatase A